MSNFLTRRDLGRLAGLFLLGGAAPAPSAAAPAKAPAAAALNNVPNVY